MADLNNLELQPDEVGSIDWESPEQRVGFPPFLKAGQDYEFIFGLEEGDPFTHREQDGRSIFGLMFKGTATVLGEDGQEHEATARFQREDFFQSAKMRDKRINSGAAELLRAMSVKPDSMREEAVKQAFQEADGRARFTATVGWRRWCTNCKLGVSTHSKGRKNDTRWPKDGKGWADEAACPGCGEKGFGKVELIRYRVPGAGNKG